MRNSSAAVAAPSADPTSCGWVAAWGTAMTSAVPDVTAGFAGRTIRNVVHPTLDGPRLRVHLSNRFGSLPVLMGRVTVAVSAHTGGRADGSIDPSDGSARPGSMREVRFAGQRSIRIPAGAEVVSDPVELAVVADHDLLVTTWTPEASGTVTMHQDAMQTSFFHDGGVDHAGDESANAFAGRSTAWHYVSGIDVFGGDGAVVAIGDSITDGATSTAGANRRWTDFLADRLRQAGGPRYGVVNAGISGNRILLDADSPQYTVFHGGGRNALARFGYDVLDRPGLRTVIIAEGINDLQQTPRQRDPDQLVAGLWQLVGQARARGLRVIGATILPWEGWAAYSPALEAARQAVNTWIRTGGAFDAVADFDAATRDPAHPSRLLPAFDSGDFLHPNDAGDRAMAEAVPLAAL